MKRFLAILISVLMVSGCGTQEYPKPQDGNAAPVKTPDKRPDAPIMVTPKMPTHMMANETEALPQGHLWTGFKWVGIDDHFIDKLRCHLRDNENIREMYANGSAVALGALVGVVSLISGTLFLGKPLDEPRPGGHGGDHGGDHGGVKHHGKKSVWGRLRKAFGHTGREATIGAITGAACQFLLVGGGPFDGILGRDFAAASVATLAFFYALVPGSDLAKLIFKANNPPSEDKVDVAEEKMEPANEIAAESDQDAGSISKPPQGPGKNESFRRLSQIKSFVRGAVYQVAPFVWIMGISSTSAYLVYNWQNDHADPDENNAPVKCEPFQWSDL
jgi:hypothetical protein